MISKFKDEVDSIEGKKTETHKIINEIAKATKNVATAKFGKRQAAWVRKLRILKEECERNRSTKEEMVFYHQFVTQVSLAKSTATHLNEIMKEHKGDAKRQLHKALTQNKVQIDAYHGGSITGNHCMNMALHGNTIMDDMSNAMLPKIRDPSISREHKYSNEKNS